MLQRLRKWRNVVLLKKEKVFFVYCGTGCTCCSGENHYRGPYKTKEDAERRVAYYRSPDSKYWPVASQYSKRGNYSIEERLIESLDDGRVIITDDGGDGIVIQSLSFVDVSADGTISDNESETCYELD